MQLESAGGAVDTEAREALTRLQTSLQTLEAAKAGAFDHIYSNADPFIANEASIPQQMETLQGRVGNLERRLDELPDGTKKILGSAAGDWIDTQLHREESDVVGKLGNVEEKEISQAADLPPQS